MKFFSELFAGVPLESLILYLIAIFAIWKATRREDTPSSTLDRLVRRFGSRNIEPPATKPKSRR